MLLGGGKIVIYRIGLPRTDDPLGELGSDDIAREVVRKPKDPVSPPCACFGCIPIFNWTMNMAIALLFS